MGDQNFDYSGIKNGKLLKRFEEYIEGEAATLRVYLEKLKNVRNPIKHNQDLNLGLPDLPTSVSYIHPVGHKVSQIPEVASKIQEGITDLTVITYTLRSRLAESIENMISMASGEILIVFSLPRNEFDLKELVNNLISYGKAGNVSIMITPQNHMKLLQMDDCIVTGSLNYSIGSETVYSNDELISFYGSGGSAYANRIVDFFKNVRECEIVTIDPEDPILVRNYVEFKRNSLAVGSTLMLGPLFHFLIKNIEFDEISIFEDKIIIDEISDFFENLNLGLNIKVRISDITGELENIITRFQDRYVENTKIDDLIQDRIESQIAQMGSLDVDKRNFLLEAFEQEIKEQNKQVCEDIESEFKNFVSEYSSNID